MPRKRWHDAEWDSPVGAAICWRRVLVASFASIRCQGFGQGPRQGSWVCTERRWPKSPRSRAAAATENQEFHVQFPGVLQTKLPPQPEGNFQPLKQQSALRRSHVEVFSGFTHGPVLLQSVNVWIRAPSLSNVPGCGWPRPTTVWPGSRTNGGEGKLDTELTQGLASLEVFRAEAAAVALTQPTDPPNLVAEVQRMQGVIDDFLRERAQTRHQSRWCSQ